jgi:hypothetical protein
VGCHTETKISRRNLHASCCGACDVWSSKKKVARKVLDAYVHYGKTERADLYGDILNDWSPQEEA